MVGLDTVHQQTAVSLEKQQKERKIGVVTEALPNTLFRVVLEGRENPILTYLGGKMRLHRIRILVGDTVEVEIDPYNEEKAKIVRRL